MLLALTTPRRLALLLFVFLAWTSTAYAWSWPVHGPVLQPFAYDEAHPYAAGQHRGIDIGADAAGESVVAPAAGTVSFAGTVPTNGKSVTIETADGYSVTLTHLGSIAVAEGATVAEQAVVGTIGPSGTPEVDGPYVHLGIRVTADPNGYVDPLGLLPSPTASDATDSGSSTSQASSSDAPAAAPADKPASAAPKSPQVKPVRVSAHEHRRARASRSRSRPRRSSRPADAAPCARTARGREAEVSPERADRLPPPAGHRARGSPARRARRRSRRPRLRHAASARAVQPAGRPGVQLGCGAVRARCGARRESARSTREDEPNCGRARSSPAAAGGRATPDVTRGVSPL